MPIELDLTRLFPEACPVAEHAARVYIDHAGDDFVGLIAHGSAIKGGFVPGCSDIDFQLYVRPEALDANGNLPVDRVIALHRDLMRIDPAPFRYIQCYAFASTMRDGWVGPIPGAYAVVAGRLPVPEATPDDLRASAAATIADIPRGLAHLQSGLLDHGESRLARHTRLLATVVWPALFSLLIVRGHDPVATWNMTKQEAILLLLRDTAAGRAIREFYAAVLAHYPAEANPEDALAVINAGAAFLAAVQASANV